MRVIAGVAKGRRLKSLPGSATRPITDRVKEALFDILEPRLEGAHFLDLFAGTGSVGIEALSRGAERAVFVDQGRKAVELIKENLALTGLTDRARIVKQDVFRFIRKGAPAPFDIVYLAPPQYRGLWAETLQELDSHKEVLKPEGLVIAQMHTKEYQELRLETLGFQERRRYGSTLLCFYSPKERGQEPS